MQNVMHIVLMLAILWAAPLGADSSVVVEGRVNWVQPDHLRIGHQRYDVIYAATEKGKTDAETYGFETECWVVASSVNRYQIDYITLVKVGYVDLARLTLEKGMVRTIEVLDLQQ